MAALPEFRAFTARSSSVARRIVTEITVTAAYDPANPPSPLPASMKTKALWDTGATGSMISSDVATTLGVPSVGKAAIHHAGGQGVSDRYVVNFSLPNMVNIAGAWVTEFPPTHDHFGAIIGMDIIVLGDLSITNVGKKTVFSFRMPSCEHIDYVAAANKLLYAGVGRNDPCPCGAKRADGARLKFKHCHGGARPPEADRIA